MNTRSKWLIAGVSAYLLFLIINLPASMLSSRLARQGVLSTSTSGSLWHGQVTGLQVGVINLGDAEWQIRFLPLFTGKLAADVKLTQRNGFAQARVAAGLSGRITLSDVSASLPLQSLVGSGGLPGGWVGTVQAKLSELVFKNNWPIAAQGTLDVIDLTGPARQANNIGAYRLQFPLKDAGADTLGANLQSVEGAAMDVIGTIKLKTDRSYLLEVLVAARANAPADITQGMQYLGAPDAQGRRPFSVSGTL